MNRLKCVVSLFLVGYLSICYSQDCTTNNECFSSEESCKDDLDAVYAEEPDTSLSYLWEDCEDNGVGCEEFGEACLEDGNGLYYCEPVSDQCAADVETCSCGSTPSGDGTTADDVTPATDQTTPDTDDTAATGATPLIIGGDTTPAVVTDDTTDDTTVGETAGTTAAPVDGTTSVPEAGTTTEIEATTTTAAPDVTTEEATTPAPVTSAARDYNRLCCKWALEGKCDTNPKFIRPLCQKSCGTYGCRAEQAEYCTVNVNVDLDECRIKPTLPQITKPAVPGYPSFVKPPVVPIYPVKPSIVSAYPNAVQPQVGIISPPGSRPPNAVGLPNVAKPQVISPPGSTPPNAVGPATLPEILPLIAAPGIQPPNINFPPGLRLQGRAVPPRPSCTDSNGRCVQWAQQGECQKNSHWMKINCQLSCNCCGCTHASIAGVKSSPQCQDYNDLCPFWAVNGECTGVRIRYMGVTCRASCRKC